MSDEEWACLEPFVIERGARSGRRPRDHRLVLDGVLWIARTGVVWRDLHEHFWQMVIGLPSVPALDAAGLRELLLEAFYDSDGGNPSLQMIEAQ